MAFNLKGFLSGSARQQQNAALDPGAQFNRALIQYTTSLANAGERPNGHCGDCKTHSEHHVLH